MGTKVRPTLVSVITVCLNSEKTIQRTIESVFSQSYSPVEYIIVDGGSMDGTLNIIRKYGKRIAKLISEKDSGISDAFNKGVKASRGEFIQLLNSDDFLAEDKIEKSLSVFQRHPEAGFVFGDIIRVDERGVQSRVKGDPRFRLWIRYTMGRLNHPTVLARKDVFERHGLFDARFRIAMDYEWLLRVYRAGVLGIYSPEVVTYMSQGGISDANFRAAVREVRDISILHGFNSPIAYAYYVLRLAKNFFNTVVGLRNES